MALWSLIVAVVSSFLVAQLIVLSPLQWLSWIDLPRWILVALVLAIVAWCLGD